MSDSTDVSLLRRLRTSGDGEAWNRFVALYTPLLRNWAARLQAVGPDRDELVQEVLVVLVRTMPEFQYESGGRFRGWMWTVTKNKWRELLRRRVPDKQVDLDLNSVPIDDPIEATDASEYRKYLVGQALTIMRSEFQSATWQAFLETSMEDSPAAEVASRLGLSVAAVYAAKSRVLRRLRQELTGLTDWD